MFGMIMWVCCCAASMCAMFSNWKLAAQLHTVGFSGSNNSVHSLEVSWKLSQGLFSVLFVLFAFVFSSCILTEITSEKKFSFMLNFILGQIFGLRTWHRWHQSPLHRSLLCSRPVTPPIDGGKLNVFSNSHFSQNCFDLYFTKCIFSPSSFPYLLLLCLCSGFTSPQWSYSPYSELWVSYWLAFINIHMWMQSYRGFRNALALLNITQHWNQ